MKKERLVTVARFTTSAEAELTKTFLKAFSIEAAVSIDDCGGMDQPRWIAGVKLLVFESELEKAKELLQSKPQHYHE